MENKKKFLLVISLVLIFYSILLVSPIGSENYNTSVAISSGGGNISSDNQSQIIVVGLISGNASSGNYSTHLGFLQGSSDLLPPRVTIVNPLEATYGVNSVSIQINLNEAGYCEYSLDAGVTNHTLTADASNLVFTGTLSGLSNGNYILNAYCNDSSGNKNYTESVSFTISVASSTPSTTSSGGGGGGGGGVAESLGFSVNPESYSKTIVLNRTDYGGIFITNEESVERAYDINIEVLEGILIFDKTSVTIPPGKTKNVGFRIYAPSNPGIYTGKIIVTAGSKKAEVLVTINVRTEKSLYDVLLSIPKSMRTLLIGRTLKAQVDLLQMGLKEKMDVVIKYFIKGFDGKIYLSESETIMVYEKKSFEREFHTQDIAPGDYILGVEVIYPSGVAVASSQFKIVEKLGVFRCNFFLIILSISLIALLLFFWLIIKRYKKIRLHRHK